MILEKETYKKFGYYPSHLKLKSSKKILAACDDCGKIRETSKNVYRSLCISCAHKGEKHHFYEKHHAESTKKKISEANKGSTNRLGKHLSEAHKKKLSKINKGKNHPFYGKHHTKETKQKQSKAKKGKKASQITKAKLRETHKGKKHSEEAKKKIGDAERGEKNHNFGKHHSKETREKMREARKHQIFQKHHTKPELIFEQICKKNNLPFKYTGDGAFWIKNINPDFVECNGKKIAVEIFGDYWHSPLLNYGLKKNRILSYRKKTLKKYGWKLIVFWESDLKRSDAERFILSEIQKQLKKQRKRH